MSYVLYHIKSLDVVKVYTTESGAKRGRTCANRNRQVQFEYMEREAFHTFRSLSLEAAKAIRVKNLMTGVEVEIPEDTPHCCRVDSEAYWSM